MRRLSSSSSSRALTPAEKAVTVAMMLAMAAVLIALTASAVSGGTYAEPKLLPPLLPFATVSIAMVALASVGMRRRATPTEAAPPTMDSPTPPMYTVKVTTHESGKIDLRPPREELAATATEVALTVCALIEGVHPGDSLHVSISRSDGDIS